MTGSIPFCWLIDRSPSSFARAAAEDEKEERLESLEPE